MVCMICIKHTVDSIHFSYGSLRPSPGMVYINILLLMLLSINVFYCSEQC